MGWGGQTIRNSPYREDFMSDDNRSIWLGFDLGGTKMLTAAYDNAWQELGRRRRKTKGREGSESGIERIASTIERLLEDSDIPLKKIAGIGIGCPGPIDLKEGRILTTPNLGWDNIKLEAFLSRRFDCPVVVLNDVDAGVFAFFLCSGSFAFFVGAGPKPKSARGLAPLGTVIFPTSIFSSFGAGSKFGLDAMTGAVLTARSIRARIARGLVPGRSFHRDTNNVGGRSPTDSFNCKNKTRRHSNCPIQRLKRKKLTRTGSKSLSPRAKSHSNLAGASTLAQSPASFRAAGVVSIHPRSKSWPVRMRATHSILQPTSPSGSKSPVSVKQNTTSFTLPKRELQ